MRSIVVYVLAALLLSSPATASIRVLETLLTPWGGDKYGPRISGENVVYHTTVSGSLDVHRVTIGGGGPHSVADGESEEYEAVIDSDWVVYNDNAAGNRNLMLHRISDGYKRPITVSPATDDMADISGDNVVYVTTRAGNRDIYWYNLETQLETPLASTAYQEELPRIDGDLVAWQRWAGSAGYNVYACHLGGSTFTVAATIANEEQAVVSGHRIAYIAGGDVALYDVTTGQTTMITATPQVETGVQISANWLAWMDDRSGDYDIYAHDLTTGETVRLTDDPSDQWLTDIEGNRVVFWDERAGYANIWLVEWSYNRPPVADAGVDREVYKGNFVQLSGSGSDPDGDPITAYLWRLNERPAGSAAALSDSTIPNPSFIADQGGEYVLTLVVWDDLDPSTPDTVVVTAIEPCPMPTTVANVYPISGEAPLEVWFDASESYCPGGYEMTFTWDFGDTTPVSHEATLWHTYQYAGTWRATLGVKNACGESSGVYIDIEVTSPATGVAEMPAPVLDLHGNYPNPFNPMTTIAYSIPEAGRVELKVYDARGRAVRALVSEWKPAGRHGAVWDGRDGRGEVMASGVYFLRLESAGGVRTRTIVLLK